MPDEPTPEQRLYWEILYLRDLLTRVAEDLELVSANIPDPKLRSLLERRSMRVRRRLFERPTGGPTEPPAMSASERKADDERHS